MKKYPNIQKQGTSVEENNQRFSPEDQSKAKKCSVLACQCFCFQIPQRVIFALLAHLAFQNAYNLRVVLNVSMPAMMIPKSRRNVTQLACPELLHKQGPRGDKGDGGNFEWTRPVELLILYAFYIGYTISHVPGGYLADRFGGRWVLILSVLSSTLLNLAFPLCIRKSEDHYIAVIVRVFMGLLQGPIFPSVSTMVSQWVPNNEKYLAGIAYSGSNLGTVVGSVLTGQVIKYFKHWQAAFYFWTCWSLAYMPLIIIWFYSYPDTHRFISSKELAYLNQKIVRTAKLHVPWKEIFTNAPFWANVCGQFAHYYMFFMMVTSLPTYMSEILLYEVTEIAYLSALPFFVLWIFSILYSIGADSMERKMGDQWFNIILGSFSNIGAAACLLGAMYAGCSRMNVMVLFVVAMVIKPFYYCTMPVNINEISKHYGGILMAIANTFATISGVFGNLTVGQLTKEGTLEEWRLVFWINLAVTTLFSLLYAGFSSATRQDFDILPEERSRRTTDESQPRRRSSFVQMLSSKPSSTNVYHL